jgi:PKD repeat protein
MVTGGSVRTTDAVTQKLTGACTVTETFTSNLPIPDNDPLGLIDSKQVSNAPGNTLGVDAKLLQVCVTIDHTFIGDLIVELAAPNGQVVKLIDRPGIPSTSFGCAEDNIEVCFELGTGNDVENECNTPPPAISGVFTAHDGDDLNKINLAGGDPNDFWELRITDNEFGDAGTLVEWSLVFNNGPVASWSPPAEVCESAGVVDLSTFVNGTPGGTFSGSGVSGNNFDPNGLSGPIDITYDVVDGSGCTDSETKTINVIDTPPTAGFTYVAFGTTINFTSTSVGGTTFSWDFGDSGMSNNENTQHTYAAAGTYTVILTATNACGDDTSAQNITVLVCTDEMTDGSFEAGPLGGIWNEASTNFGTPICNISSCGTGTGTGPSKGNFWAWFGGWSAFEEASVDQDIMIPVGSASITFKLEQIVCDSPDDFMNLVIDTDTIFTTNGGSSLCGTLGYSLQAVNIDAYADGNMHNIKFFSRSYGTNGNVTNFFVDEVTLYACPFVGIAENILDQHVSIAPNPASEFINVNFQGLTSNRVRIEVYDALGKLNEKTGTINVPGNHIERIDVTDWNEGIYFIRVYDGDFFTVKKAMVQ